MIFFFSEEAENHFTKMQLLWFSVTVGAVAAASWCYGFTIPLLHFLMYLTFIVGGVIYSAEWALLRGDFCRAPKIKHDYNIASKVLESIMKRKDVKPRVSRKTIISRSLDNSLQEVLEYIWRDFIFKWYTELSKDQQTLMDSAIGEMWQLIDNISCRLAGIDVVTFVTQDVMDILHDHFRNIRLAQQRDEESSEISSFQLHPWLRDEESEEECLRQICEAALLLLLPSSYSRSDHLRHLLREVITTSVLKVTVDMLCDPDYINEKILGYITHQEKLMADTKRTYTYAPSYEDFVKMINDSDSTEELQQMRYKIISEIMQATTINNLKKAQGINADRESSPKNTAKGELLKARNLKRYINQLTVAKQLAEKRIQMLGRRGSESLSPDVVTKDITLPGQKVLSFHVIMEKPKAREYFLHFLEKDGSDILLRFWNDVEAFQSASKELQYHLANEVFQQYLTTNPSSLPLNKATLKGIEKFLRGDGGPEAFHDAQQQVSTVLEQQHYHTFLVSDVYHQYISLDEDEEEDLDNLSVVSSELFLDSPHDKTDVSDDEEMLADQSYHARQLLRQLDAKITNKLQALQALLKSQKLDRDKIKKMGDDMEEELKVMRTERRALEVHIERTKTWTENVGNWQVVIVDGTVEVEDDRRVPHFAVLVRLKCREERGQDEGQAGERENTSGTSPPSDRFGLGKVDSAHGWAVSRTLDDIFALHEKLVQIAPWLQKKDLPSQGKGLFRSLDAAYMEKAKTALNDYFSAVMQDDRLIHSEVLYSFLAPSPEFLHQPFLMRRNKTSMSLLKRTLRGDVQDDDDFLFGDESARDERAHDSIAKPLYRLLGEVFELHGMFRWLRRSFMTFVELTFGSNINRQLREMVKWTYSEPMLLFYIRTFKDSMWPGGVLAESLPPKTEAQKFETRMAAKNKLLQNIPDALRNLVGEDNGRRGTVKVFEVLQNKALNKHLFYNLLEIFMLELCPELKTVHKSLVESLQLQSVPQPTN